MEPNQSLPLLGGLSPATFMQQYWQKKPLLVRQAVASMQPVLSKDRLFALVGQKSVESRLVVQQKGKRWRLQHGPFSLKKLPSIQLPGWTLLVQGVNLHDAGAGALLNKFRFLPDARLDDLMVSYASAGGGVGPHFDSYDVFLLQASGSRQWRISAQNNGELIAGAPLKILQNFQPDQTFVLEAGDMLYLPPGYAHEGIALPSDAENGCMTYSIGFKAPSQNQLAVELMLRLVDFQEDEMEHEKEHADPGSTRLLYQDPDQNATSTPALIPQGLVSFAQQSLGRVLNDSQALALALGETLTEPKSRACFICPATPWQTQATTTTAAKAKITLHLDSGCRMLYDPQHIYINGESWLAKGADAVLLKRLADQRYLENENLVKASKKAIALLQSWHAQGWLHITPAAR